MHRFRSISCLLFLLSLAACATYPAGPSVMAMPGSRKSFEQFQQDDTACRQFALYQGGALSPGQQQANTAVESAAAGTVVGAATGALLGGHQGAASGAGAGLLLGSVAGMEAANVSGHRVQQRIDQAYIQCMYAKGERVPVMGRLQSAPSVRLPLTPDAHYPLPPPPDRAEVE